MLDLFHIAKPQGCDIQTFYGQNVEAAATTGAFTWNKPRGASNIYMLLIGAGGVGNGSFGGACGTVTVWFGSALNVPDVLYVNPAYPGTNSNTRVCIRSSSSGAYIELLRANSASGISSGGAFTANQFASSGFFQSINGIGGTSGDPGASATTFVQPGGGTTGLNTANYGYATGASGFLQLQPIIVSLGGVGAGRGGFGSGGGATATSQGGPGMVLIASW